MEWKLQMTQRRNKKDGTMNVQQFPAPLAGLDTRGPGSGRGAATTLESQARDIIETVLAGTDPRAASARARLRRLLAVHPGDSIGVLRQHLINTRSPRPAPESNSGSRRS